MTERKTVEGAYAKIDAHEDICAIRYDAINKTLVELKDSHKWQGRLLLTSLLALLGWMAVQLWNGTQAHQGQPAAAVSAK